MDFIANTIEQILSRETVTCFMDFFVHQLLANHPILNHLLTALQNITGINKHYQLYLIVASLYMYLLFAPFALFLCNLTYLLVGICYATVKMFHANQHERKKGSFFLLLFFLSFCTDQLIAGRWWFRLYLCSKFWALYFVLISLTQNKDILVFFIELVPGFGGNRPTAIPFRDLKDEPLPSKSTLEREQSEKQRSELPPAGIVKEMQDKFTNLSQQPTISQEALSRMLKDKRAEAKESAELTDKSKESKGQKNMPGLSEKPRSKNGVQTDTQKDAQQKVVVTSEKQTTRLDQATTEVKQGDAPIDKSIDKDQVNDKPAVKKTDEPGDKQATKVDAKIVNESPKKEEEKLIKNGKSKDEKKVGSNGVDSAKPSGAVSESKDKSDNKEDEKTDVDSKNGPIKIKQMDDLKNAKQDDLVFIVNKIPKAELKYPKAGSEDRFAAKNLEKDEKVKVAGEDNRERRTDGKPLESSEAKIQDQAAKDRSSRDQKATKDEKKIQEDEKKDELTADRQPSGTLKENLSNELSPLESKEEENGKRTDGRPEGKDELNQLQEDFDKVQAMRQKLEAAEPKKAKKSRESAEKVKGEQKDAPKPDQRSSNNDPSKNEKTKTASNAAANGKQPVPSTAEDGGKVQGNPKI